MDDEEQQQPYQLRTRNRSRSETPQTLKNGAIWDDDDDEKPPYNLRSISRERSMTPGQMITSTGAKRTTRSMSGILKGKKLNMDIIDEHSDDMTDRTSSDSERPVVTNGEMSKDEALASLQNEKNERKKTKTSDYSSEDDGSNSGKSKPKNAYEFYKQLGVDNWFNTFPKTDYTYSPTSSFRYEVAPGIMAIPNMSRRSLRGDNSLLHSSQESLSENDTVRLSSQSESEKTTFFQECRNTSNNHTNSFENNSYSNSNLKKFIETKNLSLRPGESDAELDRFMANNRSLHKRSSATSLFSTIFYAVMQLITFGRYTRPKMSLSSSHNFSRFYAETRWDRLVRGTKSSLRYIYFIPLKVLHFDTWLLSQASNLRKRIFSHKGWRIFLVALLPLLLLTGLWCLVGNFRSLSVQFSLPARPALVRNQSTSTPVPVLNEDIVNRVRTLESELDRYSKSLANVMEYLENDKLRWKRFDGKMQELGINLSEIRASLDSREASGSCDADETVNNFDDRVKTVISNYFGDKISQEDFVQIFNKVNVILEQNRLKTSEAQRHQTTGIPCDEGIDERIRQIVAEKLKVYDADKTGRVDYALEPAGGQIISTRCTQLYNIRTRAFKILGVTLFYESNNPRSVIQGHVVQPGICWAFQGFPGYLLIKLRFPILVTGFTLEHAPKINLPNEDMKSALQKFEVWGFKEESDRVPVLFGEYEFLDDGNSLQYFPVQNTTITEPYGHVELRILSNHGLEEYTCLYRFRVHGRLP